MLEFISRLSKKEKIGLALALAFVMMAFVDRVVIRPIGAKIDRLNRQIKIKEEELRRDLRSLNEKKLISGEYEKYTQYVTKAGSDEEEVAKVLAEIEELARKAQVRIVDITPQTPQQVDFYKEYAAEIKLEGKMESVIKFLYQLNNSTLLLRAERLRVKPKSAGSAYVTALLLVTKILIS